MKATTKALILLLTIGVLTGCSGTGTPAKSPTKSDENQAQSDSEKSSTGKNEESSVSQNQKKRSPKEQYVANARQLTDKLLEIVATVDDPASAAKALEECEELKPVAKKLGETARKMMEQVRSDPTARNALVRYFQAQCHSDADLQPLATKLGESEKTSKYPRLFKLIVDLIETSMHNHF